MNRLSALAVLGAAVLAVTACGSAVSTASPPAHAATAKETIATRSPAPSATPTESAACRDIAHTISSADAEAASQGQRRHEQIPSLSVQGLTAAYFADDLAGAWGTQVATDQAVPGITRSLYMAEQKLITAAEGLYANYGQSSGNAYAKQELEALAAIGSDC
jgi:hypothetical protein